MLELRFLENSTLPRLAWCARLTAGRDDIAVEHGAWVETGADWFFEGAWKGPFDAHAFSRSEIVLGSGAALRDGELWFTPTTHTMERLYSVAAGPAVFVSNSLAYVLEASGSHLDRRNWSYESRLLTFLLGYRKAAKHMRLAGGRILSVHYHVSFCFGAGGDAKRRWRRRAPEPRTLAPPRPPRFETFGEYIDYSREALARLKENAVAPRRRVRYEPLATISSGYDSPACALLAKTIGCRRAVTFTQARPSFGPRLESTDDSGEELARRLGLDVERFSRDAYLAESSYPEAPFLATGGGGDDVVLSTLGERLAGTMFFTGMLGDTLWGTETQDPAASEEYRFRFPAGGSMQEFRLHAGFVHVPVPLLTFTRHGDILRISRSEEMSAWRIGGGYDRPIPRRILEEQGVPRGSFASEKRAITQPFWLQRASERCMSRASLADFERFKRETVRSYPLGALQMGVMRKGRGAFYKIRKLLARSARDPYAPTAHLAAATTEPLRFHWAVEKARAAYRATGLGDETTT
ncbi:MAG TPA: hypothetical protein VFV10_12050 [Gammaproteobacteria bacterium]|nr:hypothetical protein [Gammaproteobacteria bacterium]